MAEFWVSEMEVESVIGIKSGGQSRCWKGKTQYSTARIKALAPDACAWECRGDRESKGFERRTKRGTGPAGS